MGRVFIVFFIKIGITLYQNVENLSKFVFLEICIVVVHRHDMIVFKSSIHRNSHSAEMECSFSMV